MRGDVKLPEAFTQLKKYLLDDLRRIAAMEVGGNYAAALLVTTACEALGDSVCNGSAGAFFSKYVLPPNWEPVGSQLYDAVRHGLAHRYDIKTVILVDGHRLEIGISWRGRPHLEFDVESKCLVLNVQDLVRALESGLDQLETELLQDSVLRDLVAKSLRRKLETTAIAARFQAWKQLVPKAFEGAA